MISSATRALCALTLAVCAVALGHAQDTPTAATTRFALLDRNHDGTLSAEEYDSGAVFRELDTNQNYRISLNCRPRWARIGMGSSLRPTVCAWPTSTAMATSVARKRAGSRKCASRAWIPTTTSSWISPSSRAGSAGSQIALACAKTARYIATTAMLPATSIEARPTTPASQRPCMPPKRQTSNTTKGPNHATG